MKQVKLYLNSGHTIEFECDDIQIFKNTTTGRYEKAEWTGSNKTIGFNMNELVGFEVVSVDKEEE